MTYFRGGFLEFGLHFIQLSSFNLGGLVIGNRDQPLYNSLHYMLQFCLIGDSIYKAIKCKTRSIGGLSRRPKSTRKNRTCYPNSPIVHFRIIGDLGYVFRCSLYRTRSYIRFVGISAYNDQQLPNKLANSIAKWSTLVQENDQKIAIANSRCHQPPPNTHLRHHPGELKWKLSVFRS